MNQVKENISEELHEKIISVAYDDAGLFDRIIVKREAKKNNDVKNLLEEYRLTANEVKNINKEDCPNNLVELATKYAQINQDSKIISNGLLNKFLAKPVLSAIVILIIGSGVFFLFNKSENDNYGKYSKAEVEYAEQQVKETLGFVGKTFKKTEETLEENILLKRVTPPVNKGINLINNLFIGG